MKLVDLSDCPFFNINTSLCLLTANAQHTGHLIRRTVPSSTLKLPSICYSILRQIPFELKKYISNQLHLYFRARTRI